MFTCPACDRTINPASEVCPYCQADLAPATPAKRGASQRRGLLFVLVGGALLIALIWGIVWFVLPRPNVPPHAEAEASAVAALRQVSTVVTAYEKREGGYPVSIEQVSGQAGGAFADAREEGYFLSYHSGKPGADGNIHSFILLARPAYYGYRNFYVDQTGVIRFTTENRPATKTDPPIS
jgi:hypothetical protein